VTGGVLRPATEAELAEAVRTAGGPLRIAGGGTRAVGRPVAGTVLSTAALAGIVTYEPGALTLVARAGTPLAEVEAALAAEGQRLPFEPPDLRPLLGTRGTPTLGGAAAANAAGPRRVTAGAARDAMIGVRFVDGTGMVVKSGGRVMKNVTGYDLVKLLAGSWGTLGVITEVALKVLPAPEASATLVLEGLGPGDAVEAMAAALSSPFEVNGAAHLVGGATWLRLEGFAESVADRAPRLARRLARWGAARTLRDAAEQAVLWARIRDAADLAPAPGDVWRLVLRPSEAAGVLARAGAHAALIDAGGAVMWLSLPEGTDLRARLGPFTGHATLIRAAPATRAAIRPFPPEPPVVARLSEGLRRRFDPRGILNPGLMA
jgi:glycolate oxidase FAD binding subunit